MASVLALGVGTSPVRALVHDERGRPVAGEEARTRYEPGHPVCALGRGQKESTFAWP